MSDVGWYNGVFWIWLRPLKNALIQSLATTFAGSDRTLKEDVAREAAAARLTTYLARSAALGRQDPTTVQVLLNGLGQIGYSAPIHERLARLFASFRAHAPT